MNCRKCGAAVNGKFCSCCGQRVRSALEEYRLAEKRMERDFTNKCSETGKARELHLMHLASAWWKASSMKYDRSRILSIDDYVPKSVYDNLQTLRDHAEKLYKALIDF